jgi:hypothetical protein
MPRCHQGVRALALRLAIAPWAFDQTARARTSAHSHPPQQAPVAVPSSAGEVAHGACMGLAWGLPALFWSHTSSVPVSPSTYLRTAATSVCWLQSLVQTVRT